MSSDEVTVPGYGWPDLWARRSALGVTARDMANLVGIARSDYSRIESGTRNRRVPERIWDRIVEVEAFVARVDTEARQVSEVDGVIWLWIASSDDDIAAAYPDTTGMTAVLHRVGIGRAAATLAMTGATVRITTDPPADSAGVV